MAVCLAAHYHFNDVDRCDAGHSGQPEDRVHDGEHPEVPRVQHGARRASRERRCARQKNGLVCGSDVFGNGNDRTKTKIEILNKKNIG